MSNFSLWHPTPVLLPGKSHGQRSLVGCSPWGCEELDTTERLHFHFSPSCVGEGNGNPLQCSCLENPRDGGAWWAAVYGVAQSWTWLKWLSSSSSSSNFSLLGYFQGFLFSLLYLLALTQEWVKWPSRACTWGREKASSESLCLEPEDRDKSMSESMRWLCPPLYAVYPLPVTLWG